MGTGGVQYYRYAWDQSAMHTFAGTESTWSNAHGTCPTGSCTDASATLTKSALADGNNWYLHVRAFNAEDVANGSGTDYGPYFFDGTLPVVSNLSAETTPTTATVSWTTNEPTTTQLEWGTTTSYGNTTTLDPTRATNHSVKLEGLASGTTFHVRAVSKDEAGNVTTSDDVTFTTKTPSQTIITNVVVTKNSPTSVTIAWTTNEPATSKVRYGLTTDYGGEVSDPTLVTSHSLSITTLQPNTTYHYEVISTGSTTDTDADATFTTEPEGTTISAMRVIAGETIATFFWETNEPATSKVRLGRTSSYTTVKSSDERVRSHRVQIRGLQSGTTYHYQLESVGSSTVATIDQTFATNTPESTKNRAIGPTLFTPVLEDGGKPTLHIPGVAKGAQTLRVFIDEKLVKTLKTSGKASSTKAFVVDIDIEELTSGKHTLYVQATDEVGRTSIIREKLTFTVGAKAEKNVITIKGKSRYTVQPGDSLWKIAERFLGDGARYPELVKTNAQTFPSLLKKPGTILPGWVLTIPPG